MARLAIVQYPAQAKSFDSKSPYVSLEPTVRDKETFHMCPYSNDDVFCFVSLQSKD